MATGGRTSHRPALLLLHLLHLLPLKAEGGGTRGRMTRERQTRRRVSEGARRLKPGDFAQVDGLHGLLQVRLDVPPQFVRVRLRSCGKEGEIVRRRLQSRGNRVGGGSGGLSHETAANVGARTRQSTFKTFCFSFPSTRLTDPPTEKRGEV